MITEHRALNVALVLTLSILFSSASATAPEDPKETRNYGLIEGTVYGPDDRPIYGVKVQIHPVGKKHPNWEHYSDHRGEFAQRVPLDTSDYEVVAEAEIAPVIDGKAQHSGKKRVKDVARVHVDKSTVSDVSLHLKL